MRSSNSNDEKYGTHLERVKHGAGEEVRVLLGAEVQAVDLLVVAPLVERGGRLVVLEALQDGAVDDDLVVLQLPADDPKRLLDRVLVDVDLGEARRRARRHPLLVDVVVHHDTSAGTGDRLFTKKILRDL